ncbi:negative regulation of gluconeogenesis-related protein [Naematelia encephala]|uniref:GID complex catalytic subunit 2 n=1 Tax=Naematelia encephala TaxID=71784 RepID=A0A1Y2AG57_9TREE|nr:negative regulation of gluconeogenesis-related protein [Naematelia encephala]
MEISAALTALESLASSPSTSSSGPLTILLDKHFSTARQKLLSGEDAALVLSDLQKQVTRAKKDVEKGLKGWYGALGGVGKAVEKAFPPNLAGISEAYDDPPLFVREEAREALDRAVMDSMARRGLWEAVAAMEEETGQIYNDEKRSLAEELGRIVGDMENGELSSALEWCNENTAFLRSPPHPSSLPYYLHRTIFLSLPNPSEAMTYARSHLLPFLSTHPVLELITSRLYIPPVSASTSTASSSSYPSGHNPSTSLEPPSNGVVDVDMGKVNPYPSVNGENEVSLINMFRGEYCRRHGLPKEDPLGVAVDLGGRGGALAVVEKARRVMGERLGNIRAWEELPMEVPLPASRRYHSVFVCPVSKEQATESNPPKMLTCGHVLASESFDRLLKGGRRSAKCPYCPVETSQSAAQRLYF